MKKIIYLLPAFFSSKTYSNPTSGWNDMYDGASGGDGIWPYLLIGFALFITYGFLLNWYEEYKKKKIIKAKTLQDNIGELEQKIKNSSKLESSNELTSSQNSAWKKKLNKQEKRSYIHLFKYFSLAIMTVLLIGGVYSLFRYVKLNNFSNKFIELEPVDTYFDDVYKDSDYFQDFLDSDIYEEIKYAVDSYEQCKLGQKGFKYALAGVSWSNEEYIDIILPGLSLFNPLDRYIYRNFIYENKLSVCENNYLSSIRDIDAEKPGDIYLLMQL